MLLIFKKYIINEDAPSRKTINSLNSENSEKSVKLLHIKSFISNKSGKDFALKAITT